MSDLQKDTPDAREASMSRVQTLDTVMASLASPASVEAAKESQDPKPDDKPSDGEQKPAKKTAQDRIVDLVHKNRESEAKANEAADRAQRLESELNALKAQAKPMESTNKPSRAQFVSEDDFIEALTDWKADSSVAKRERQQIEARQQAEQAEVAQQWDARQQTAIKAIPDYAEVLNKSEVVIPPYIHQALLESEHGPEIAYYLALHPEEAKRLAAMKPLAAMKRIVSLESDLAYIEVDEKPAAKVSEAPKKSKAPEPINPIKGIASVNAGPAADYAEYRRRRLGK